MSVIIFLIILSALVVVHELGHFLAARRFGIRVDEFGLGYPPKARRLFKWRETDFTLNWLPFGGFVKIFGENPSEETGRSPESLQNKNRGIQAAVLFAGVFFNFLFAWLLISLGLVTGLPAPTGIGLPVENPRTVVTLVVPGSPADLAGLKPGDTLVSLERGGARVPPGNAGLSPEEASVFIAESLEPIIFTVERGGETSVRSVAPQQGLLAGRPAIGVSMEVIGTAKLSLPRAVLEGTRITWELTVTTAKALGGFVVQAIAGRADLSAVTGPVGLIGMVGDARLFGLGYLLSFIAIISINLSLINLLPFPALDGGRLLFVAIEAITRRPIPARFFNAVNAMGFALLVFLMILITIRDVRNIF